MSNIAGPSRGNADARRKAPPQEDGRRAFLVRELRTLWITLRDIQLDVEAVASGLKSGTLSTDEAIGILHGARVLHLLHEASATATGSLK
jgi:hypothetical protein